jgi:hypothetical protein
MIPTSYYMKVVITGKQRPDNKQGKKSPWETMTTYRFGKLLNSGDNPLRYLLFTNHSTYTFH